MEKPNIQAFVKDGKTILYNDANKNGKLDNGEKEMATIFSDDLTLNGQKSSLKGTKIKIEAEIEGLDADAAREQLDNLGYDGESIFGHGAGTKKLEAGKELSLKTKVVLPSEDFKDPQAYLDSEKENEASDMKGFHDDLVDATRKAKLQKETSEKELAKLGLKSQSEIQTEQERINNEYKAAVGEKDSTDPSTAYGRYNLKLQAEKDNNKALKEATEKYQRELNEAYKALGKKKEKGGITEAEYREKRIAAKADYDEALSAYKKGKETISKMFTPAAVEAEAKPPLVEKPGENPAPAETKLAAPSAPVAPVEVPAPTPEVKDTKPVDAKLKTPDTPASLAGEADVAGKAAETAAEEAKALTDKIKTAKTPQEKAELAKQAQEKAKIAADKAKEAKDLAAKAKDLADKEAANKAALDKAQAEKANGIKPKSKLSYGDAAAHNTALGATTSAQLGISSAIGLSFGFPSAGMDLAAFGNFLNGIELGSPDAAAGVPTTAEVPPVAPVVTENPEVAKANEAAKRAAAAAEKAQKAADEAEKAVVPEKPDGSKAGGDKGAKVDVPTPPPTPPTQKSGGSNFEKLQAKLDELRSSYGRINMEDLKGDLSARETILDSDSEAIKRIKRSINLEIDRFEADRVGRMYQDTDKGNLGSNFNSDHSYARRILAAKKMHDLGVKDADLKKYGLSKADVDNYTPQQIEEVKSWIKEKQDKLVELKKQIEAKKKYLEKNAASAPDPAMFKKQVQEMIDGFESDAADLSKKIKAAQYMVDEYKSVSSPH